MRNDAAGLIEKNVLDEARHHHNDEQRQNNGRPTHSSPPSVIDRAVAHHKIRPFPPISHLYRRPKFSTAPRRRPRPRLRGDKLRRGRRYRCAISIASAAGLTGFPLPVRTGTSFTGMTTKGPAPLSAGIRCAADGDCQRLSLASPLSARLGMRVAPAPAGRTNGARLAQAMASLWPASSTRIREISVARRSCPERSRASACW